MSATPSTSTQLRSDWIVLKFGGTSVSTAARWQTVADLAEQRLADAGSRALIVVSALSGVTSQLQRIADGAPHREASAILDDMRCAHQDLARALGLDAESILQRRWQALDALFDEGSSSRSLAWQAGMLAQGEILSSSLGAAWLQQSGLPIAWIDARDWLVAQALPNQNEWSRRLAAACAAGTDADWRSRFDSQPSRALITQGFIARHPEGGTATLGRGGSDTSAACFGALLGARRVEIWTDVPGMFTANPAEVRNARLLSRLDYAEAQEIATTGAKVLHPRAIGPCREAGVPIAILDSARPHLEGTLIDSDATTLIGVKAIARREGIVLVSMESIGMWQQVGFLADVFERFKRHGMSVDLIGSSETNVTVSLDPGENLVNSDALEALATDLAQVCRVKIIAPTTSITLVGRGMRSLLHRLSGIWAMFGRERVHLISQSSNDLNLTFVIDAVDAEGMLPMLHAELIRSGAMPTRDTRVFGPTWKELVGEVRECAPPWWRAARARLLELAALECVAPGDGEAEHSVYVYHLPTVRAQARALSALPAIDRRFYALKANPHPEILRALEAEGFGFECVSVSELVHLKSVLPELAGGRVLFTPSFVPRAEYEFAYRHGAVVTIDQIEPLQRWPEVFKGRTCWLRVDTGRGEGHHEKVRTGGAASKFGLPIAAVDAFVDAAAAINLRIEGLHAHLGSGVDAVGHGARTLAELAAIADRIGTVTTLDVGGGLPVPYAPGEEAFDIVDWVARMADLKSSWPRFELAIEPGRFLVAAAGVLLTRVAQVASKDGVARVGVAAGMHTLLRPALYDAWHEVVNLSRIGDVNTSLFDVVGPICESGDVLGRQRPLPSATAPRDVVLIADAGAYGAVMASRYNLRPLPREVCLDD